MILFLSIIGGVKTNLIDTNLDSTSFDTLRFLGFYMNEKTDKRTDEKSSLDSSVDADNEEVMSFSAC